MIEFGKTLREAREKKGLTISQIAESTRMMTTIVEGLEREDFRKIAAPIYGRGFVKLYCEAVDLDPRPMIAEFMAIFNGERVPTIKEKSPSPVPPPPPPPPPADVFDDIPPAPPAVSRPVPQPPPAQPVPEPPRAFAEPPVFSIPEPPPVRVITAAQAYADPMTRAIPEPPTRVPPAPRFTEPPQAHIISEPPIAPIFPAAPAAPVPPPVQVVPVPPPAPVAPEPPPARPAPVAPAEPPIADVGPLFAAAAQPGYGAPSPAPAVQTPPPPVEPPAKKKLSRYASPLNEMPEKPSFQMPKINLPPNLWRIALLVIVVLSILVGAGWGIRALYLATTAQKPVRPTPEVVTKVSLPTPEKPAPSDKAVAPSKAATPEPKAKVKIDRDPQSIPSLYFD